MRKLSQAEIETLAQVPVVMEALLEQRNKFASDNSRLRKKIAKMELRERCTKIASDMHVRGIEVDVPADELVERLMKVAKQDLKSVEQAVAWTGPDMGAKLATLADNQESGSTAVSDFERFISQ